MGEFALKKDNGTAAVLKKRSVCLRKVVVVSLAAFAANIVMLLVVYKLFLSASVEDFFIAIQAEADGFASEIAASIEKSGDYADAIDKYAAEGTVITLECLDGRTVYASGKAITPAIEVGAAKGVVVGDDGYILKVVLMTSLKQVSALDVTRRLLWFEVLALFIITSVIALYFYVNFVKPIEKLGEDMHAYSNGKVPERTERSDEIGDLRNDFAELAERLNSEKKKQNRIIASISHDIKTPLTSVMGYAERLSENAASMTHEKRKIYLDTIYEKSLCIKELVEEFDDYISAEQLSDLRKSTVSISELCGIVKEDYRYEMESMGFDFDVECSCDGSVEADIPRIRRVFGNIILNSLKYCGSDKISIKVTAEKDGKNAVFTVADNGAGVPEDKLERIFEPLYTSDESRGSSGLGLAICSEIVKAHRGSIRAENIPSGFAVIFTLPLS